MGTEGLNMDNLKADLDSFKLKVDHNMGQCKEMQCSVISDYQRLKQSMTAARKKDLCEITRLQNSIETIQQEYSKADCDQEEHSSLNKTLHQLKKSIKEKEAELSTAQQNLVSTRAEVSKREQVLDGLAVRHQDAQLQPTAILEAVELYHRCMGLAVRRENNATVFTFTQVKSDCPDRAFELSVSLSKANSYILTSSPQLHDLRDVQNRLNATNNLSGCLAHVRKLYQGIP